MNPKSFFGLMVPAVLVLVGLGMADESNKSDTAADQTLECLTPEELRAANIEKGQKIFDEGRKSLYEAREILWKVDFAGDEKARAELRREARRKLTKSRASLKEAHNLLKGAFEAFPKFIPREDEAEEFLARQKVEAAYLRSQIELAQCRYVDAQTHVRESKEFKEQIAEAAEEFKDIHEKYRSMVGGLYARLWQGKCYEETNDIGKALGIYNELLAHPGQSSAMRILQDTTRHFRLICLNSDARRDYRLVQIEAEDWLSKDQDDRVTQVEMGIRFQKAVAHEKLARQLESNRKNDTPNPAIELQRNAALKEAELVAKHHGENQALAKVMINRLKGQ